MTGGKRYFFVAFPCGFGGPKLTVVWNRMKYTWQAMEDETAIEYFSNPIKAKRYLEAKWQPAIINFARV